MWFDAITLSGFWNGNGEILNNNLFYFFSDCFVLNKKYKFTIENIDKN